MNQDRFNRSGSREDRRKHIDRRTNTVRRATDFQVAPLKKSGVVTLAILASLSTLALVLFFVYQSNIGDTISWGKMMFLQNRTAQEFQMGGVELGMSPKTVERKHPNLDLTSLVRGEKIATFEKDSAKYTVWFVSNNGVAKAYRIRYDQTLYGKTETDIIEDFGRRHGKPGTTDCTRGAPDERKCHFQWWPSGGIALNVLSTTKNLKGKPVTRVTMIATDTYLDGKRIRNMDQ